MLWRVSAQWKLPVLKALPDGSCLSEIHSYRQKRRDAEKIQVRIIEYKLTGEGAENETYRLITSVLDAAVSADIDPDRLSFTHAGRVIRRKPPRFTASFSPSGVTAIASGSTEKTEFEVVVIVN